MSADIERRLRSLFARGVVSHDGVESGMAMSQAEFLAGEVRRLERPQPYGFGSAPSSGYEVFAVFANGVRDQGIIVASDDARTRPTNLLEGQVILYGANVADPLGHQVLFTDNPKPGTIVFKSTRLELRCGTQYLTIDAVDGLHASGPITTP